MCGSGEGEGGEKRIRMRGKKSREKFFDYSPVTGQ